MQNRVVSLDVFRGLTYLKSTMKVQTKWAVTR
jgi:predicted acyltransferase